MFSHKNTNSYPTQKQKISFVFVLLVVTAIYFSFISTTYAATSIGNSATNVVSDGLVGHWTFDGENTSGTTATDISGQGNNGTLTNMTAWSGATIGKLGQALRFNGSNNYVDVGTGKYTFTQATPFSGSAWIKTSATGQQVIMGNLFNGGNPGWMFELSQGGGGLHKINLLFINTTGTQARLRYGSTIVDDGKWHHVAFAYDGSSSASGMKLYVDGSLESMTTALDTDPGTFVDYGFRIGSMSAGSSKFNGVMDDVRIYNRTLTPTEVQTLYKAGGGVIAATTPTLPSTFGLNNGLVGHWTFDGKDMISPTLAKDLSGKNFNASYTTTKSGLGKIGQAAYLPTNLSFVTVSATTTLNNMTEATYAFWFKGTAGQMLSKNTWSYYPSG